MHNLLLVRGRQLPVSGQTGITASRSWLDWVIAQNENWLCVTYPSFSPVSHIPLSLYVLAQSGEQDLSLPNTHMSFQLPLVHRCV